MATITIHPGHVEGLRYLVECEFESVCEASDVDRVRDVLALGDQLGWKQGEPAPSEVRLPETLLDKLVEYGWEAGNEGMAAVYCHRAHGTGLLDPESMEREARSMLVFAEHHRAQAVAS